MRNFSYRTLAVILALFASASAVAQLKVLDLSGSALRTMDPLTGTTVATVNLTLGGSPVSGSIVTVDPTTQTIYALVVINNVEHLTQVDAGTGVVTEVGALTNNFVSMAFTAEGELFGLDQVWGGYLNASGSLYRIDKTDAQTSFVTGLWFDQMDQPYSHFMLTFNPSDGLLYSFASYYNGNDDAYYLDTKTINPSDPLSLSFRRTYAAPGYDDIGSVAHLRGDFFLLQDVTTPSVYLFRDGRTAMVATFDAQGGLAVLGDSAACAPTASLYGTAHAASGDDFLYGIDPATGEASMIGPVGFAWITGIDFDNNRTLYAVGQQPGTGLYADNAVLLTIETCTGAGSELGPVGTNGIYDIAIRPTDGALFAYSLGDVTYSSGELLTIDKTTGAVAQANATGNKGMGSALAFNASADILFQGLTASTGTTAALYSVLPGPTTLLSQLTPTYGRLLAMDADGTGTLYGLWSQGAVSAALLTTVNPQTGAVTSVATTQTGLQTLAFSSGNPPSTYTLTVLLAGNGSGSVASGDGEIDCGSLCGADFAAGSSVTLMAIPAPGYKFAGWSGGCSGSGKCVVTMTAPRTVTATFRKLYLRVYVYDGGTVLVSPPGITCDATSCFGGMNFDLPAGTAVTLTAAPTAGFFFTSWYFDGTAPCPVASRTCAFTIKDDMTAVADFEPYTVHLRAVGNGKISSEPGGDCPYGGDCYFNLSWGTEATFIATPAPNNVFVSWSDGCASASVLPACQITVMGSLDVTANFAPVPPGQMTINVSESGPGTISDSTGTLHCGTSCAAAFPSATTLTLTAAPASGAIFVRWTGDCVGSNPTCNVTLDLARTVSATFIYPPPPLQMQTTRFEHTATLLNSGKVLVAGGFDGGDVDALDSAELFDPASRLFLPAGSMSSRRFSHTATLLLSGKVLIAGGWDRGTDMFNTAELYDPSTDSFAPAGTMTTRRSSHTATLLLNGKVLLTGGFSSFTPQSSAEIYDPADGSFKRVGDMTMARATHTATLLDDGRVLITGGSADCESTTAAEVFDPATNAFSTISAMTNERGIHAAVRLQDGRVLVAGGAPFICNDPDGMLPWSDAEVFDPTTSGFGSLLAMTDQHRFATAALLQSGNAIVIGGGTATVDLFDAESNSFTTATTLVAGRSTPTATVLKDGRVLITGGSYDPMADLLDANAQQTRTPLTVNFAGSGGGAVYGNNMALVCMSTCTAYFDLGSLVTLVASPDTSSFFGGWSGACAGATTCVITMDTAQTVTASFYQQADLDLQLTAFPTLATLHGQIRYEVILRSLGPFPADGVVLTNVLPAGVSLVSFTANRGCSYSSGVVTCALPMSIPISPAYVFVDIVVTADQPGQLSNTISATLLSKDPNLSNNTRSVVVTVPGPQFTLTVSKTGSGTVNSAPIGISCGSMCSANFDSDTPITLTAIADPGFTFAGWNGGGCSGTSACVVALSTDTTVAATFTLLPPNSYSLTVTKAGTGTGMVVSVPPGISCGSSCSVVFTADTSVVLTATALSPSNFDYWSGCDSASGTTCMVTMSNSRTVVAVFAQPDSAPPSISIVAPAAGSSVSRTVTLSASASDDVAVAAVQFKLDGQSIGPEVVAAPYAVVWDTTLSPNGPHTITASARDTAGNIGVAVAVSVTVDNSTDFQFALPSGASSSATVSAGTVAKFTLNIAPSTGFSGPISFTCSGAPVETPCSISPNPAAVSGTAVTTVTITLATTKRSSTSAVQVGSAAHGKPRVPSGWPFAAIFATVVFAGKSARRSLLVLIMVAALVLGFGSCGGGGPSSSPPPSACVGATCGTPAGSYTIVIGATAEAVTHSYTLTLTVT